MQFAVDEVNKMNEELKALAMMAGAPDEVMDELWFNIFCKQFAHLIILEMETSNENCN
jgi:hypothetical protein